MKPIKKAEPIFTFETEEIKEPKLSDNSERYIAQKKVLKGLLSEEEFTVEEIKAIETPNNPRTLRRQSQNILPNHNFDLIHRRDFSDRTLGISSWEIYLKS